MVPIYPTPCTYPQTRYYLLGGTLKPTPNGTPKKPFKYVVKYVGWVGGVLGRGRGLKPLKTQYNALKHHLGFGGLGVVWGMGWGWVGGGYYNTTTHTTPAGWYYNNTTHTTPKTNLFYPLVLTTPL